MSADEVTHGADADASRVRTGPRHAAPRKPLLARIHLPAGKAIALAAMPTAVLMGMGFTPTLARADDQPTSKSLTAEEYEACVDAMTADESASASPSSSPSETSSDTKDDSASDSKDTTSKDTTSKDSDSDSGSGGSSSSDSGSDDTAEPSPSASSAATSTDTSTSSSDDSATASPSDTETSKSVLETIGDAIKDVFDGDSSDDSTATATASPSPSASASASTGASGTDTSSGSSDSAKETTEKTTETVKDAVSDAADAADDTADTATEAAESPDATASSSPSPSASATTDVDDCPVATEDESGIDNKLPLPDDPWYLNASSLLLKGADYQGIVKVKMSNGKTKEVLKYVISGGTEIGDLHQTVIDKQAGKTYHVQAGSGTKSTIEDGDTVMYTESISGNLFGLIPVTFTPENPPPLNIPLIYFTNVKVQQAGQFGGTLTVPGLHQYTT
ncbi:hypothetical protein ABZ464_07535 [Streptomyces sp. NPDC005820]|uniref:hypothetical protein n=1 Tax=Streptomyces sp. NPDC005820 TaxID=3157069 RepID=UPI0033CBAC28